MIEDRSEDRSGDEVEVQDATSEASDRARAAFEARAEEAKEAGAKRPRADLLTLTATLAGQAMVHLGAVPHPITKKTAPDLDQARYTIDLLGVLEEKTKGNLTSEEERVLRSLLTDLRLRYVDASR